MAAWRGLAAFVAFLCLAWRPCFADVEMILVLHRHGARTRLEKNNTDLAEGASTLTRVGMNQLVNLGSQIRARYLDRATCTATGTCLQGFTTEYDHTLWYVSSSQTDRTLVSVESLLLGLFPPTNRNVSDQTGRPLPYGVQPVPINNGPLETDWILRAYDKCSTFLDKRLPDWYKSAEFLERQQLYAPLLQSLQSAGLGNLAANKKNLTLQDMFNVYDAYNVQFLYGAGTPAGGAPLPLISAETWQQLQDAANWLEYRKFARPRSLGLMGGGLLADMLKQINSALISVPPVIASGPKAIIYSAHYPTMLSFLSALHAGEDPANDPNPWLQDRIPEYGAALVLEVSSDPVKGKNLRLVYQNGENATVPFRQILLPCSTSGDGTCSLAELTTYTAQDQYATAASWCRACANVSMPACMVANFRALQANGSIVVQTANGSNLLFSSSAAAMPTANVTSGSSGSEDGVPKWSVAVGTIGGVAVGSIVGSIVAAYFMRNRFAPHRQQLREDGM